jgi:hypothetical protein
MKRNALVGLLAVLVLGVVSVSPALAAAGKLTCFTGSGGTCTKTSATSATLDTRSGGYAGLYITNAKFSGMSLMFVDYSFNYTCLDTAACVAGGSPRLSIPIDTNLDGKTDGYAFLDAVNCADNISGYDATTGAPIYKTTGTVSTTNTTCKVFFQGVEYANWDAFAQAAKDNGWRTANAYPFVIADQPFYGSISGVTFTRS